MLNAGAFANALAVVTAVLYLVFAVLALLAPAAFQFLFNAQFFGADVSSLFPRVQPSPAALVTFILMVVSAWTLGYAWAWLYNRFARAR